DLRQQVVERSLLRRRVREGLANLGDQRRMPLAQHTPGERAWHVAENRFRHGGGDTHIVGGHQDAPGILPGLRRGEPTGPPGGMEAPATMILGTPWEFPTARSRL